MITMDDRAERRRSPLLGNPYQHQQKRRTLLSADDSIAGNKNSGEPSGEGPAKRRKGLLSTPETGIRSVPRSYMLPISKLQPNISSPRANDFKRKRPALLSGSPGQMPNQTPSQSSTANFQRKQSFPAPKSCKPVFNLSTNPSKPTAPNEPPSNRRVLLPLSSEQKVPTPSTAPKSEAVVIAPTPSGSGSESKAPSADNVSAAARAKSSQSRKTSLLDYLSSDLTVENTTAGDAKRRDKATMTDRRSTGEKSMADLHLETDLAWLHQQRALIDKRISELQDAEKASVEKKDVVVYISGYYCQVCRKIIRGDYGDKTAHCNEESHLCNTDACADDPETVLKYFEERYDGIAFEDDADEGQDTESPSRQSDHKSAIDSSKFKTGTGDDGSYVAESDDEDERTCERFDRTRISRR